MDTEQRGLDALNQIDAKLEIQARGILDKDVLCAKYSEIKDLLQDVLDLLGMFPIIGKKVVGIIEFLMAVANQVCDGT